VFIRLTLKVCIYTTLRFGLHTTTIATVAAFSVFLLVTHLHCLFIAAFSVFLLATSLHCVFAVPSICFFLVPSLLFLLVTSLRYVFADAFNVFLLVTNLYWALDTVGQNTSVCVGHWSPAKPATKFLII
jgi:hypothetical protein